MEQAATSPKPFNWIGVLLALGPIVVSVGLAYGTTKFVQGETQKSITVIEKQLEHTPSRLELQTHMDALHKIEEANANSTRDQLKDIKENLIELRKEVRQSR